MRTIDINMTNQNTNSFGDIQLFKWQLQPTSFTLRKNIVLAYPDLSYVGLRSLLTLFLSMRENKIHREDSDRATVISPQYERTIYSHPLLPTEPIFIENLNNHVHFVSQPNCAYAY
jgi:hypothetical protein